QGQILSVDRKVGSQAGTFDAVVFIIELSDMEGVAARVTNTWLFLRSGSNSRGQSS
nr:hypothetical protein [Gammaproteobacteria bacterium]